MWMAAADLPAGTPTATHGQEWERWSKRGRAVPTTQGAEPSCPAGVSRTEGGQDQGVVEPVAGRRGVSGAAGEAAQRAAGEKQAVEHGEPDAAEAAAAPAAEPDVSAREGRCLLQPRGWGRC
ncbi:hypothetical protein PMKS-003560 [Pichia membranifaciens]|uniref:Uncharacterized protein n=1 Tax=Pichia membranifaciens TaxID=4926 RepID=A0A1Q2YKI6_9ASCO|nr:hypothetical protein PMKS-003560 [Pichia membranifaciens]